MSLYRVVTLSGSEHLMKELGSGTTIEETLKDTVNSEKMKVEHPAKVKLQRFQTDKEVWVDAKGVEFDEV